jgi:predicted component of type VI protein secretion system
MPRLKITTGKQSGKTYDVAKATIIGRGDTAQVQISDNHASREHCKVFEQGGAWVVADLNSRNGIKVNDVQTTRKNLANGDRIVIGETTLVFETASAPAASPAKTAEGGAPSTKASAGGGAASAKEAAFAAARAGASAGSARSAAAVKSSGGGGDAGLKVSDRVLQFNKVDPKKATVLDVDLAQSATLSRLFIWVACLAFVGGVVWVVVKLLS